MVRFWVMLLLPLAAAAADNPWAKVKELKTGQELRIIKKGAPRPVMAAFDELTGENLVVVIKGEQTAIPRDAIERVDARPVQTRSRVKTETKSEVKDPEPPRGIPNESRTPSVSSGSTVSVGSKPDFETVYRRTASR